jgi:hypothetical protein
MKDLEPLVARLKTCPTRDTTISLALAKECWGGLCRENIHHLIKPPAPVMAALLVESRQFAALLNEAEHTQLLGLVNLAADRFETMTQPANKLGQLLADSLKST